MHLFLLQLYPRLDGFGQEDEFSRARTTRVRIENAEEIKMKKGREIY
jgi:hypothetical protein